MQVGSFVRHLHASVLQKGAQEMPTHKVQIPYDGHSRRTRREIGRPAADGKELGDGIEDCCSKRDNEDRGRQCTHCDLSTAK